MLANLAVYRFVYGTQHRQAASLGVEGRIDKSLHDGQKSARALLGLLRHAVELERQIDHLDDTLIRLVVYRRNDPAPAGRLAFLTNQAGLISHQLICGLIRQLLGYRAACTEQQACQPYHHRTLDHVTLLFGIQIPGALPALLVCSKSTINATALRRYSRPGSFFQVTLSRK